MTQRPLVLVSWHGGQQALPCVHLDAEAQFDWLLFDYTGQQTPGDRKVAGLEVVVLSQPTECKGDIFQALGNWLHASKRSPEYVGLIDDDVWIGVSDINRALFLARCEGLDVFSPTLMHDSHYTHRWMLSQPHQLFRYVDWVEVMMPFYRGELFLAGRPHMAGNVSSWGMDKYLWPTLQKLRGETKTALIDAVQASHRRPITSGEKTYRNGRTAFDELSAMRDLCRDLVAGRKDLQDSAWYARIFEQRHVRSRWQQLSAALGRPLRRWLDQST
ncbi:hypothetical protein [Inhella sp.]|uniref:hypothetical protein n=1 Tax=Inhella sp. TaxID=1921806 RepID=UPI0035B139C2